MRTIAKIILVPLQFKSILMSYVYDEGKRTLWWHIKDHIWWGK